MSGDDVSQIKDRIDITALVGERVRLKHAGHGVWVGLCPFHQEKSGSFYVYEDSRRYVCFGCGEKGDAFDWLAKTEGLDFPEALKELAARAGVTLAVEPAKRQESARVFQARSELERRAQGYTAALRARPGRVAMGYLEERGINAASIENYGLGFAVRRPEDRLFGGRLIFSLRDELGQLVGFAGRTLEGAKPKYVNSAQSEIFDKGKLLYNLDRAKPHIRRKGEVLVCEGYTDVILADQTGHGNVVASMGTSLTAYQASKLMSLKVQRIILCLDGDAAGEMATVRGVKKLQEAGAALSVLYVASMPKGKDPADILLHSPDMFDKAIAEPLPLVEFAIRSFAKRDIGGTVAQEKSFIVAQVGPLIRALPDPIERDHYIVMLAKLLAISESAVREAVTKRKAFEPLAQEPVNLGRQEATPDTKQTFDRERHLIGLIALDPAAARALGPIAHRDMFQDVFNGIAWEQIRDILRYHPEVRTTDQLLDLLPTLEYQQRVSDAVDDALRLPHVRSNIGWESEIRALGNQLLKSRALQYRNDLLRSLPEAFAAGDKDRAQAILKELDAIVQAEKNQTLTAT